MALLLPSLLLIALYLPSLDHEFAWTDQGEIEHGILIQPRGRLLEAFSQPMHPQLESLAPGAVQPYYRPLQVVVASVVDAEFGKRPRAFRSVTIGLGALTMALFTGLAWWLLRDLPLALLAGALVAVHPVGIEMYAWIAGLSGALAHLFVVLSLLAAALSLSARRSAGRLGLASISIAALLAGLLSKESAAVTPALLLALFATRGRAVAARPGLGRAGIAGTLLAAHGALTLAFTLWWRPRVLGGSFAGAPPIDGSATIQLLTSLASWPGRLAWLFAPTESTTSDVVRVVTSPLDPVACLGVALLAASLPIGWRLLRSGRSVAAFGLAWIWIAFLPTSGLIPLTHLRAERYLALSVFGVALLVVDLLPALSRALLARGNRTLSLGIGLLMVAGLAQRSATRIPDWRSDLSLFARDVERDPLFREGYYILATRLAEAGRFREAHARLTQLRELAPRFGGLSSFLRSDDAFLLLCRVNRALGLNSETIDSFGEELRAQSPALPGAPALFSCAARALEQVGRFEEAIAIAARVRDLDPSRPDPMAALTVVRCQIALGRSDEAERGLAAIPTALLQDPHLQGELLQVRAMLGSARRTPSEHDQPQR
jgi:tetratricopeptide (TPR) repeat protein